MTSDTDKGTTETVERVMRSFACSRWERQWTAIATKYKLFGVAGPEVGFASRFRYADSYDEVFRTMRGEATTQSNEIRPIMYPQERCLIQMDHRGDNWLVLHKNEVIGESVPLGTTMRESGAEAAKALLTQIEQREGHAASVPKPSDTYVDDAKDRKTGSDLPDH
jgi:hypothetical protein